MGNEIRTKLILAHARKLHDLFNPLWNTGHFGFGSRHHNLDNRRNGSERASLFDAPPRTNRRRSYPPWPPRIGETNQVHRRTRQHSRRRKNTPMANPKVTYPFELIGPPCTSALECSPKS